MPTVAILGCDDLVVTIVRAIRGDSRWHVIGGFDVPPADRAEMARQMPGVPLSDRWESLLAAGVDVVLVGRNRTPEMADDELRKLVQDGARLLLTFPPCEAIIGLELEMIRRDTGAALEVYYPGCRHEALEKLKLILGSNGESLLGYLQQVQVDRFRSDRSRSVVLDQLARDAHWLHPLVGEFQKISALTTGGDATDLSNLQVQATTTGEVAVRWSIQSTLADSVDSITFTGTGGRIVFRQPASPGDWDLQDGTESESMPAPRVADEISAIMLELAAAETGREAGAKQYSGWPVAVRALEVADLTTESLRRSRTIEMSQVQVSEESTFKAMMAAAGCLLVLLSPLILIGAALVERLWSTFEPRRAAESTNRGAEVVAEPGRTSDPPAADIESPSRSVNDPDQPPPRRFPWLALALASPLIFFLLLQSLQLVFRRRVGPPANSP